jgi:hypothetical protein
MAGTKNATDILACSVLSKRLISSVANTLPAGPASSHGSRSRAHDRGGAAMAFRACALSMRNLAADAGHPVQVLDVLAPQCLHHLARRQEAEQAPVVTDDRHGGHAMPKRRRGKVLGAAS